MTRAKQAKTTYFRGTGTVPEVPDDLSAAEVKVFEQTFKAWPHLSESQVLEVARYAQQSVLLRSLSRRVAKHGASTVTASGTLKRSPDAILLEKTQIQVAALSRSLALDVESQRLQGFVTVEADRDGWEAELARSAAARCAARLGLTDPVDVELLQAETVSKLWQGDRVRLGADREFLNELEVACWNGREWWSLTESFSDRDDLSDRVVMCDV